MLFLQDFLTSTLLAEFSGHLYLFMKSVQSPGSPKRVRRISNILEQVDSNGFATAVAYALRGNVDEVAFLLIFLANAQADNVIFGDLWKVCQ